MATQRINAGPRVLLTGRPGSGKTTLIKHVLKKLSGRAGGFYTEEIRKGGIRVGFKIVTLNGEEAVLAHVDFTTAERIGKYRLDLSALEAVGVKALREAIEARRLIAIDEIGPMEIRSAMFREAVTEAFDGDLPVLATIFARPLPFIETIKRRPGVTLIEIRPDNRDNLVSDLAIKFRDFKPTAA